LLLGFGFFVLTAGCFEPQGPVSGSAKLRDTLNGHTDFVHSVAFSPDGKTLASGSMDNTIKLWDVATGRNIATLDEHTHLVYSVAFTSDGKILASGTRDGIKLWDVATAKNTTTFGGRTDTVHSVAFSPDGTTLASGHFGSNIKLWNVASGKGTATFTGHAGPVFAVTFSPDGKTLASGSDDRTVKLWDVASGKNVTTFIGHADIVWSVAFSPDGKTLASASMDEMITLWAPIFAVLTWLWYGQERDERCLGWCLGEAVLCIGKWWRSCRVGLEHKVGHHDHTKHHLPHPPPPCQAGIPSFAVDPPMATVGVAFIVPGRHLGRGSCQSHGHGLENNPP
jgi:uncharacterized protein with WD repeat